jgi:hypothetical protein
MAKAKNFMEEVPADLADDETTQYSDETAVARRESGALLNPNVDNINLEGVRPPYLTVTHGVGEAAEHFNPGDLVLAKENLVCPKGKTIDVIILNQVQYAKQRVSNDDWSAGIRPQTFFGEPGSRRQLEEAFEKARAAGFSTAWVGNAGPDVSPALDLTLLLRKPDDLVCGLFGIDIGDGNEYAICKFTADKGAYNVLLNDYAMIAKTKLKASGLFSALWELRTELGKPSKKGNRVQTARLKFKEMLPADTVQGITAALQAPSNG